MISKNKPPKREQLQMISMDELIPENHLLRKIEETVDFSFIYELVEGLYSEDRGRPSEDPVTLTKIVLIQYLYGIRSMRQTIEEIRYNAAYRWFLGLDFYSATPHFTTFGKNYKRRFEGTDLFEQIFAHVLELCMKNGRVYTDEIFVDATHIKASANKNKKNKIMIEKQAKSYHKELMEEINKDRVEHDKKPFDDDDGPPETTEKTGSKTDPDSGMFVKGEHKREFAYSVQTACDKHGYILAYDVSSGNTHDSVSFDDIYPKIKSFDPEYLVMDSGYKTPNIMRKLLTDGITPVVPYTAPKTKKGFFRKHEYAYDELNDCYICPQNQILSYRTTNRDGYKEYKSNPNICSNCADLDNCTHSKNHTKVVTRHVWEGYLEEAHHIRYSFGMKELYAQRKETIERVFADAKEKHSMRYTHYRGKAKVTMTVALIFAAMNLKKMVRFAGRFPLVLLRFSCSCFFKGISVCTVSQKPLLSSVWRECPRMWTLPELLYSCIGLVLCYNV